MRIAFIAPGSSIHTRRWLQYFADRKHEVHLVTLDSGSLIENVKIHELSFRRHDFPLRAWRIRRIIKEIDPDILHAHFVSDYGVYGALSGFHPLVLTAWGSDVLINPNKSAILKRIVKFALKKADLITCDAEHVEKAIRRLAGYSANIKLIYFGIDTQKFSPEKRSARLREELDALDSPVIISLRNLDPIYDVKSLINSASLVLREFPKARFVIASRGSQEAELMKLADSLGISDSIKFVGFIPNEKLPQYLASSDIYVSTSLSDGGLSACTAEAMACELPVIITDFGDNRKWVRDGINGFLVPRKDFRSLAEKIVHLIKSENIRMKFGKIRRKIIEERLNYWREMEKMEHLYDDLTARHLTA